MEFESELDESEQGAYQFGIGKETVNVHQAITALLADVRAGVSIPAISARFHNGLAGLSRTVCAAIRRETGVTAVALSGGVWQNMALLTRTVRGLRADGFKVYIHHQVPTNDGGLSLGQALVAAAKWKSGNAAR